MVTMHIEKKTTLGYIIGVWRFIELICILQFAQIIYRWMLHWYPVLISKAWYHKWLSLISIPNGKLIMPQSRLLLGVFFHLCIMSWLEVAHNEHPFQERSDAKCRATCNTSVNLSESYCQVVSTIWLQHEQIHQSWSALFDFPCSWTKWNVLSASQINVYFWFLLGKLPVLQLCQIYCDCTLWNLKLG